MPFKSDFPPLDIPKVCMRLAQTTNTPLDSLPDGNVDRYPVLSVW